MKELPKDDLIKYLAEKRYISDRRASVRHFIDKYINKQDVAMALDLTLHFYSVGDLLPADLIKIENFLLQMRNPGACFRFVMNVPTNKLSEHEEIVLQANNPHYSKKMATLKGANAEKHSQVILASKDAKISCEFLNKLPFVDKQEHINVIANGCEPYYMLLAAKKYCGVGCKKLENAILNLKDAYYSTQYAKQIAGADIMAHQTVVMFFGDAAQILEFAKEVESADMHFMITKLHEKFNRLYKTGKIDEAKEYKKLLESLMQIKERREDKEKT